MFLKPLEAAEQILHLISQLPPVNRFDPIADGEEVLVVNVDPKMLRMWCDYINIAREIATESHTLHCKIEKLNGLAKAFWGGMKVSHKEAAEADKNGLIIGMRKNADGRPVLVASKRNDAPTLPSGFGELLP